MGTADPLGSAVDAAGLGWIGWEVGSGMVAWSPLGRELSGGAETIGAWLATMAPPDRARASSALIEDAVDGRLVALDYRTEGEQGSQSIELRGRFYRAPEGGLRGTALLRDVTDVRKADERLHLSEARFREVFEGAPIAIVVTTLADVLVDVNEAFAQLTGYARDEVVGRSARELGFWSSTEDQEKLRSALQADDGPPSFDARMRTKSGRVREVLVSIARGPIDHAGGYVKMLVDITERRGSERRLVRALREVMQDTSWLAQNFLDKLAELEGFETGSVSLSDFTPREREVLELMAQGKSNARVARELGLATSTVRNYVSALYVKLGVESRAEAVVWARERGLGGE